MIFFTWNSSRLLWRCSFCFIFCHNTVAMVEGAHDCDKLMTTQLCCNFFQLQKQHVLCIDLNLQVSIFFVTSVGFFFLTSISRFLFYDLYVLIAIGFHFYDLYVLSHCHRVPFFWPLFQGSQYHWSRAWKMFWLISLPMVLLLGMIF